MENGFKDLYKNICAFHDKFREGDQSFQEIPRTGTPQILDRQSLKATVYTNLTRTSSLDAHSEQKSTHYYRKSVSSGSWISFKLT